MNDLAAIAPAFATRFTNADPHFGHTFDPCRSRNDATCWRCVFHVAGNRPL